MLRRLVLSSAFVPLHFTLYTVVIFTLSRYILEGILKLQIEKMWIQLSIELQYSIYAVILLLLLLLLFLFFNIPGS